MESEYLKKALKDPESMEVFVWTLLVKKRESTDDYEMGGMTKNELRHYAKDYEEYSYAKFRRAVNELEAACIIYHDGQRWHDHHSEFSLPKFD